MLSSNLSSQSPKNFMSTQNRLGSCLNKNARHNARPLFEFYIVDFKILIKSDLRKMDLKGVNI